MGIESVDIGITQHPDWESARLPQNGPGDRYLVALSLVNDPTKIAYAFIRTPDPRNTYDSIILDIPTEEHTPKIDFLNEAYLNGSTLGERDEELYLDFATKNLKRLLALLNRETAGTQPIGVSKYFYETFGVEHGKAYGSTFVSSYGGSNTFNVTIEPQYRHQIETSEEDLITHTQAAQFAQSIQESLPHIQIAPLSKVEYLDTLYNSLQFLPRDWESK